MAAIYPPSPEYKKNNDYKKNPTISIIALVISSITMIAQTYIMFVSGPQAIEASNKKIDNIKSNVTDLNSASLGTLDKGQKLCRVLSIEEHKWKDGIIVPQNWSRDDCGDYALRLSKDAKYQLGCIFSDSLSLGQEDNGTKPDKNCGW